MRSSMACVIREQAWAFPDALLVEMLVASLRRASRVPHDDQCHICSKSWFFEESVVWFCSSIAGSKNCSFKDFEAEEIQGNCPPSPPAKLFVFPVQLLYHIPQMYLNMIRLIIQAYMLGSMSLGKSIKSVLPSLPAPPNQKLHELEEIAKLGGCGTFQLRKWIR